MAFRYSTHGADLTLHEADLTLRKVYTRLPHVQVSFEGISPALCKSELLHVGIRNPTAWEQADLYSCRKDIGYNHVSIVC